MEVAVRQRVQQRGNSLNRSFHLSVSNSSQFQIDHFEHGLATLHAAAPGPTKSRNPAPRLISRLSSDSRAHGTTRHPAATARTADLRVVEAPAVAPASQDGERAKCDEGGDNGDDGASQH